MSTENFFRYISAFWPHFASLPGLLRLFSLTALPSQCTCLLLLPLLPCLRVGFDFFNAWLLSPRGNCKLQENASTELNLDASCISVLLFHASGQGSDWENESRSRSETAAKLWLFPYCPWAMRFPLKSLFQQSGKWHLAQDWLWWWNQTRPDLFGFTSSLLAVAVY